MLKMKREYVNFRKFVGVINREHLHGEREFEHSDKFSAVEQMLIELLHLMDEKDPEKLIFKIDILNADNLPVERVTYSFKKES